MVDFKNVLREMDGKEDITKLALRWNSRQIRELVYARKDYLVRRIKSQANRIFSGGKDREAIAKRKPTTSDFETRNSYF